jgi:hypothetical protein
VDGVDVLVPAVPAATSATVGAAGRDTPHPVEIINATNPAGRSRERNF